MRRLLQDTLDATDEEAASIEQSLQEDGVAFIYRASEAPGRATQAASEPGDGADDECSLYDVLGLAPSAEVHDITDAVRKVVQASVRQEQPTLDKARLQRALHAYTGLT